MNRRSIDLLYINVWTHENPKEVQPITEFSVNVLLDACEKQLCGPQFWSKRINFTLFREFLENTIEDIPLLVRLEDVTNLIQILDRCFGQLVHQI